MLNRASNGAPVPTAPGPAPAARRRAGPAPRRRPALSRGTLRGLTAGLILAAFGLFLLGNERVPLWDRDEPRYAECSRQMLQGGDWVVPQFLNHLRTQKPPLIYWCQAAAMAALGDTPFAARLPSALAMAAVLGVLAVAVGRVAGPARALATVLVMSTPLLVYWSAKVCLTDSVLLLLVMIAQLCLYAVYRGRGSWPVVLTMWLAVGLAGLTKGPLVVGVLLGTMIVLAFMDCPADVPPDAGDPYSPPSPPRPWLARAWRATGARLGRGIARAARDWWGRTRPLVGLVVVAAVVGPWLYLIEQRAPGFLASLVGGSLRHVSTGTEHHSGPPGYHLVAVWGTFFPWSLLLPAALGIGWKHRRLPPVRFALAAVIGTWVLVELVQTKLPHYFLPAFPPLAFLVADALARCARGQHDDLARPAMLVAVGVWAVAALALGLAPWLLLVKLAPLLQAAPLPKAAGWAMAALSLIAGTWAVVVYFLFRRRQVGRAAASMGLGMLALMAVTFGLYLPHATFLRQSRELARLLIREGATHPGDVVMIDYKEPSLAFYQGGTIVEQSQDDYLKKSPASEWPRWVVLSERIWEQTPAEARAKLEVVGSVLGLKYADRGRIVNVLVVRKKG